jgi:phosphatidylserine/phosphatidylglycerophosphate/cardiolipin synthase-like enzyme
VASSQAYAARFGNKRPDQLPPAKREQALQWLSRELDDAMLRFIDQAGPHDALRCCFYEFRYPPVAKALKAAIKRGVDVSLIVDAKANGKAFPRDENLATIKAAGIARKHVILREARASSIQHNKFMVLLRGPDRRPVEVWTGSTNVSVGGITGQTNVGHWVRDRGIAVAFMKYWHLLADDPGGTAKDTRSQVLEKNAAFAAAVEAIQEAPSSITAIPGGVTPVFSPRASLDVLDLYADLVDSAQTSAAITLAFGIGQQFKKRLLDNTPQSHIVLMLLEKKDVANPKSAQPFVALTARNNVYQAWGAFLRDPVYQWARETNARILKINQHVSSATIRSWSPGRPTSAPRPPRRTTRTC